MLSGVNVLLNLNMNRPFNWKSTAKQKQKTRVVKLNIEWFQMEPIYLMQSLDELGVNGVRPMLCAKKPINFPKLRKTV